MKMRMKMSMRRVGLFIIAAAIIAGIGTSPQTGLADYIANIYLAAAYQADTMTVYMVADVDSLTDALTAVTTSDGIWSDPDLTVELRLSNTDITEGESIPVELGNLSGYRAVYVKFLATIFPESITVYVGTSENAGWATGNTAYFDRDPSTVTVEHWALNDSIGTYGTCIPLINTYGTWLPGPYGVMTITNDNDVLYTAQVGDSVITSLSVIVIKRK